MSSIPSSSNSNKTFTITPSSELFSLTTYKIRVTNEVKDISNNFLNSQFETSSGFTTTTPSVSSTTPNFETSVSINSNISVNFTAPMDIQLFLLIL